MAPQLAVSRRICMGFVEMLSGFCIQSERVRVF